MAFRLLDVQICTYSLSSWDINLIKEVSCFLTACDPPVNAVHGCQECPGPATIPAALASLFLGKGGCPSSLAVVPHGFTGAFGRLFRCLVAFCRSERLNCVCIAFPLCRAKRRNGRNPTSTAPASTAPQCALSARPAQGREGRGGERKRGVGHPLYSVPVLSGFPSSARASSAVAAPGWVWHWPGGSGRACAWLCVWCVRSFPVSMLQEGSEWIPL